MASVGAIPTEAYNRELQQVDTADAEAMAAFVARYGIPASPCYDGVQRLRRYRGRFVGDGGYEPAARPASVDANIRVLDTLSPSVTGGVADEVMEDVRRLAMRSELARLRELGDERVRGVVSMDEVAHTIRLLQVATTLPAAVAVAIREGWDPGRVADYLANRKYVAQGGADCFLDSDDPMFCGHRIASYDTMWDRHGDFREMVRASSVQDEGAVRTTYDFFLAEAYVRNAQRALDFLSCASQAYAGIPATLVGDGSGSGDVFRREVPGISAHASEAGPREGSLAEALIFQFTSGFVNETPYRRCKNCGRVFKKYREEKYKPNGHIRETAFCRKSCNVTYVQRQKRLSGSNPA